MHNILFFKKRAVGFFFLYFKYISFLSLLLLIEWQCSLIEEHRLPALITNPVAKEANSNDHLDKEVKKHLHDKLCISNGTLPEKVVKFF